MYVLIVDDDYAIRRLLQVRLAAEGFKVATAEDGQEALLAVEECVPDLILLDGMLPGMPGSQVARELRRRRATTHVPILMVSALNSQDQVSRAYAAGVDDYLAKPFLLNDLIERVRTLMARSDSEAARSD